MRQRGAPKLGNTLVPGLLLAIGLLVTACSGPRASATPEPATLPVEGAEVTRSALGPEGSSSESGPAGPSQDFPKPGVGQRIRFERISVEPEPSQSAVFCVLEDSKGFMWFGTEDGLQRHDGYTFVAYRHDPQDPHSLSSNHVTTVYEDRAGVLWVGTAGGGLERFDRDHERFIHYQHDPGDPRSLSNNRVQSILEDRSGVLWIGTDGGGLDRFDRQDGQFVHYQHDPNNPHSLSNDQVRSIYQDRSGVLWVGIHGGGLDQFDRQNGQFVHHQHDPNDPDSLSNDYVWSIYEDRSGALWVGTWGGLDRLDRATGRFVHHRNDPDDPYSLGNDYVWSIYEDRPGVLWVGTWGGGLQAYDRQDERFVRYQHDPDDPHSLSHDAVWSIYEDRSGVLWVGTGGGLDKYDRGKERFLHYQNVYNDRHSLRNNRVWSICEGERGVLWIGTAGGLARFDRATERFTHYQHDPNDPHSLNSNFVLSVYADSSGVVWIGTWRGLDKLVPAEGSEQEKERFVHYQHDPDDPDSLSNNQVWSINEDRLGVLWVGTAGGLNKLDRATGRFVHYQRDADDPNSLSGSFIRSIYKDRSGVLWIGMDGGGLNRFDRENEQFVHYRADSGDPGSLSHDRVFSIHEDRSGVLWIGTAGGGLNKLDRTRETFIHYRREDGLPSDVVYGILEDDASPPGEGGNLWLSTNNGLSKFDPRTETFRNYGVRDGLQGNEFSPYAFYKSSSGEMFFGGANGFNAFYPANIKDNPYIPPVVLTLFTQSGEDVDVGVAIESVKEVTFDWPNNFFEFEFAALNYSQPERNQYAYMLEGLDKDWNYVGIRRFGRYTNLPGRTYTLRVKGSNNDEIWNQEGVSVRITIVPPFWATWWFRGGVALVLVGGIVGGYRLRVKSIESRTRELEAQVTERTYALAQRTHELEERTRETERRRQELEALYRADEELYRYLRLDQVLRALVDIVVDILRADKSALMVWDDRREKLVVRVARGFNPKTLAHMSFAPGEGIVGHVAVTGEPLIVEDACTDARIAKRAAIFDPEGICSFMQVPIKIGGEVFGVFSADYVRPHVFGSEEQRLFAALAQRAALVIEKAQLYEQAQELAVVEERSRLARELHDAVTQTLFSASLIAEILPALWESNPQEGRQFLQELRQLSRGALAEMRTLLLELRPAALVEADLDGLLRQLAEALTGREGIPVVVTVEEQVDLPAEVHVALYRIAQEALNNVVKHAQASQVEVSLRCEPFFPGDRQWSDSPLSLEEGEEPALSAVEGARVELCIRDNGRGFDPGNVPPDRLGLGIIRERAQAIGAVLEIDSQIGRGTRVKVIWTKDE